MSVLKTTISPRPLAPAYVQRRRLRHRIDRGLNRGLVMIVAPPGYGKTALATEWYQAGSHDDRCWMTLTPVQNTTNLLLAQFVHTIRSLRPDALDATLRKLEDGHPLSSPDELTSVINDLCNVEPITVVVDDLDAISDRPTLDSLAFLIDHVPPSIGLIVCCRRDPLLPLARWRSTGRLEELRASDLRFTPDEAGFLLDLLAAGDLTQPQIDTIVSASGGWPTGVYLAGIAAREGFAVERLLDERSGGLSSIGDFLVTEVLDDLPQESDEALIETSIVEELTPSLVEAITQRTGAYEAIRGLSHEGLFVEEVLPGAQALRVHPMLRTLLYSLLTERYPAEGVAALRSHAAHALVSEGRYLDAVEQAQVAGDIELVESLLRDHGRKIIRTDPQGLVAALRRTDDVSRRLSDLELYTAIVRPDRMHLDVEATRFDLSDDRRRALEYVRAHFRGETALGNQGLDRGDLPQAWADVFTGVALAVAERYHASGQRLMAAGAAAGEDTFLRTASLAGLGWNNARAGRLGAARSYATRALHQAVQGGHPWFYPTAWARLALAQIAYDQGRLDDAHHLVSAAAAETALDDSARVEVAILDSRLLWALGDRASARTVLNNAFTGGDGMPITGVIGLRLVLGHVALALLEHDRELAAAWLPDWEHRLEVGPTIPTERLVLAGLLIEHDRPDEARGLLARPEVEGDRSHRCVLEGWRLASVAAARSNDPAAAMALEIAVSMAQTEGFVQMFTEDAKTLARVGRPLTSGITAPVGRVAAAIAEELMPATVAKGPTEVGLVEELTERELAVLRYMPTRFSNREIAEELYVSINTVKSHVKNVYRKLGVTTRREAVSRAAALRLM